MRSFFTAFLLGASEHRRSAFYLKMEAMLIQKSCTGEAPEPSRTLGSKKLFNLPHAPKSEMFSSCVYCGRIHAEGYICSKKPIKRKKIDDAVRFRNSSEWNRKRLEIRARDNYLCQICIRELYGTRRKYNCEDLQVHHVVPISSDEKLQLDNSNLITLCSMHHAMCDRGEIPYDEVKEIIKQQEKSPPVVN